MQRIRYGMTVCVCVCMCERESERDRDRETRCMTQKIRKLNILTKEKTQLLYKVGGGCFI